MTSPDVEERLELNCGVVREHEAADATEVGGGGHAVVSSCSDVVNGGAGKVESGWGEAGTQSGRAEAGTQRDGGQHVHQVLGWTEEGEEQPCKKEFLPESPVTVNSVEQRDTLHIHDGVWQRCVKDAATQQTWLLVNPFSLQVEFLGEARAGVSSGHL